MADYGYVYCLDNPAMPGIFKVGKTGNSVMLRAAQLSSSTSVPASFRVLFYYETSQMSDLETAIHAQLELSRLSKNREFFKCDPRIIKSELSELVGESDFPVAVSEIWESLSDDLEYQDYLANKATTEAVENGQNSDS